MTTELEAITLSESKRLVGLEQIITEGRTSFLETGLALLEIHRDRLYRNEFTTFQDYCTQRWGFSRQRGYQLIAFAKDAEVTTAVDTDSPKTEWQSRKARSLKSTPAAASGSSNINKEVNGERESFDPPRVKTYDAEFLKAIGGKAIVIAPELSKTARDLVDNLECAIADFRFLADAITSGERDKEMEKQVRMHCQVVTKILGQHIKEISE